MSDLRTVFLDADIKVGYRRRVVCRVRKIDLGLDHQSRFTRVHNFQICHL
jgi:hypothetical protein